jgi:hypothetical protein
MADGAKARFPAFGKEYARTKTSNGSMALARVIRMIFEVMPTTKLAVDFSKIRICW